MSSLSAILAPVITALDTKFNYVRASVWISGNATWIKTNGVPSPSDGAIGQYCTDVVNNRAYGPKTSTGWGSPLAVGSGGGGAVLSTKLSAIDTLSWAANQLMYFTGTGTVAVTAITAFARGLLAAVDAVSARSALGLGGAATLNVGTAAGTVAAGDDARFVTAAQAIASVTAGAGGTSRFIMDGQTAGDAPFLVGSLILPAGSYNISAACIGCANPLHAATVQLQTGAGTVVQSITAPPGGVKWVSSVGGFSLPTATELSVVLFSSAKNGVAYIRGMVI